MLRAILFLALYNQIIAWISALMTDLDLDCKPLIFKRLVCEGRNCWHDRQISNVIFLETNGYFQAKNGIQSSLGIFNISKFHLFFVTKNRNSYSTNNLLYTKVYKGKL